MKTYWTVVYRPQGSRDWMWWHGDSDVLRPVWRTQRERAEEIAADYNERRIPRAIMNPPSVVPLEFRVAKVEVEE